MQARLDTILSFRLTKTHFKPTLLGTKPDSFVSRRSANHQSGLSLRVIRIVSPCFKASSSSLSVSYENNTLYSSK